MLNVTHASIDYSYDSLGLNPTKNPNYSQVWLYNSRLQSLNTLVYFTLIQSKYGRLLDQNITPIIPNLYNLYYSRNCPFKEYLVERVLSTLLLYKCSLNRVVIKMVVPT